MSTTQSDSNAASPAKNGVVHSHELVFRVVVIALLLSSLGFFWWSYQKVYAPRVKASRECSATVAKLSAEVDDLDRRWPPADIATVNKKFALVDPRLFADQSALEAWLADFREQLPPLGLDVKATFAKTVVHSVAERNLAVIPTTIFIEVHPVNNSSMSPSPYQRLLQLTQNLAQGDKRADLTELTVESSANSIGRAVVGVNFWTGGKEEAK